MKKQETLKDVIKESIPYGYDNRITLRELVRWTGLSSAEIKKIIAELRIELPIVAQHANGGGYWVATTEAEIKDFINLITAHRNAVNKTISIMQEHLIG